MVTDLTLHFRQIKPCLFILLITNFKILYFTESQNDLLIEDTKIWKRPFYIQLGKWYHSNEKNKNTPIRKRKYFQSKLVNGEMAEEQEGEQKDKNKCMDHEIELAVKKSDVN